MVALLDKDDVLCDVIFGDVMVTTVQFPPTSADFHISRYGTGVRLRIYNY